MNKYKKERNIKIDKYWIWLSLIKNIKTIKKIELLQIYKEPNKIWNASFNELKNTNILKEAEVKNILESKNEKQILQHYQYIVENNIKLINIQDKRYPQILKEIYTPPILIYLRGNDEILNNKNIAIVGCREASNYGCKVAYNIAKELSKNNINIISGLARGIDSKAHLGSVMVKSEGKTIAVLGNGLDTIYPSENIELARMILKNGGAIISEYPIGSKPEKQHFPARNRIISGISKGVIVVEAKKKSGTLITVDFALEQGRDVYCVPRKYKF